MTRNFLNPGQKKDDQASISSGMADSTYMSQPDTGRRVQSANGSMQFQVPQDTRSQVMEPFLGQGLYSPTLSVDSHGTFATSQAEISHMMLPPASGASDQGDSGFRLSDYANYTGQVVDSTNTGFRAHGTPRMYHSTSDPAAWGHHDMQGFNGSFPNAVDTSSYVQRVASYPGRSVSQPFYGPYQTYSIDTMISNPPKSGIPSPTNTRRATRPVTSRPSTVDAQSMVETTEIVSPNSTITNSQYPMFHGGSEYGEVPTYINLTGGETYANPAVTVVAPGTTSVEDVKEEFIDFDQDEANRSSEEAEVKLARTHPLYQATVQADDMYHCPYEGQANCGHKATKLKCNYDKYVDSHLKPFRCKNSGCIHVEFSSTACLLRHEREAHGMHGHGSKPHLCAYPDCERAIPGNGFPRRYNLYDHMKRVHDYTSPMPPTEATSPQSVVGAAAKRAPSRKRKSGGGEPQPEKRQRSSLHAVRNTTTPQQRHEQEVRRLQQEWSSKLDLLRQTVQRLEGHKDIANHQKISEEASSLQKIAEKLIEMG